MIAAIRRFIRYIIQTWKGRKIMMAMFFAQRVILGKTKFDEVPGALKAGCAEVLIESGLANLVPAAFGGTAEAEA